MRKKSRQNKSITRFLVTVFSVILVLGCLTGCGNNGEQQSNVWESGGNSEVETSGVTASSSQDAAQIVSSMAAVNEAFNAYHGKGSDPIWAGVQVYNGEVVEVWRKVNGSSDKEKAQDIYLFDAKNSGRVIVSGVPADSVGTWFYTAEGYCLNSNGNTLSRVEADGTKKFTVNMEDGVRTIVQLEDGTIVVLMKDMDGFYHLAVLNPESGEYKKVEGMSLGKDHRLYIASDREGVVLMNKDGFWNVNLETGELTARIPMREFNYTIEHSIKTFRMMGGAVELLYQGTSKTILPKDIQKYRTVVELFAPSHFLNQWLELQVDNFNRENPFYYVEVVAYGQASGVENQEDLLKLLEAESGPDLILSTCFDNVQTVIDKGYLEDLVPYMEQSGIYEDDYFATTFETYKRGDSIYGAPLAGGATGLCIQEEVLGSREIPDVEQLVDALLAYTEPAVIDKRSEGILQYFMSASKSLCDTVDWESGTCNFNTNLFSKILEVSKLYGKEENNMLPVIGETISTSGFYDFINEEQRRLAGKVYIGYLFDEGAYPAAKHSFTMHINSSACNKEGAWALIADLLGEESQMQLDLVQYSEYNTYPYHIRYFPVNIYAYDIVVLTEIEETALVIDESDTGRRFTYKVGQSESDRKLSNDEYRAIYSLTRQDADEMLEMMYKARNKPTKTLDLQQIICEEAAAYFSGERSLGDTCEAIQERAQIYLNELEDK